jgi:hypothetical protein
LAVTSWRFAATTSEEAGGGTTQWFGDTNGLSGFSSSALSADDGTYAWAGWANGATTYYLKGTNFGFTSSDVPVGATINGIEVRIRRFRDTGPILTSILKFIKGGTISGNNIDGGGDWPTTETSASFGSASELGGLSWSQSDVVASNFGAGVQVVYDAAKFGPFTSAIVESMEIRINYTVGGGGTTRRRSAIMIIQWIHQQLLKSKQRLSYPIFVNFVRSTVSHCRSNRLHGLQSLRLCRLFQFLKTRKTNLRELGLA